MKQGDTVRILVQSLPPATQRTVEQVLRRATAARRGVHVRLHYADTVPLIFDPALLMRVDPIEAPSVIDSDDVPTGRVHYELTFAGKRFHYEDHGAPTREA